MKNVLVLTYWPFQEALVQTYTLPYVVYIRKNIGSKAKLFLVTYETDGPNVTPEQQAFLKQYNIELVTYDYTGFSAKAILQVRKSLRSLRKLIQENDINYLHCWGASAGGFGYLLQRKTNVKLVLDSFEPHAESMVENGTWKSNSKAFKIQWWLEKKQALSADHLIALTEGMKQYATQKYGTISGTFHVKPSLVDLELFGKHRHANVRPELGFHEEDVVCVYAGKIGGIYYREPIYAFWKACTQRIPNFKVLFLTNFSVEEGKQLEQQYEIPEGTILQQFVPHVRVPELMAQADFAINPVVPVPSKRYCTSIKDGEYWATGLPVVISPNISDDSGIIEQRQIGAVLDYEKPETYAEAIDQILSLLKEEGLTDRIVATAKKYRHFDVAEKVYESIYG